MTREDFIKQLARMTTPEDQTHTEEELDEYLANMESDQAFEDPRVLHAMIHLARKIEPTER